MQKSSWNYGSLTITGVETVIVLKKKLFAVKKLYDTKKKQDKQNLIVYHSNWMRPETNACVCEQKKILDVFKFISFYKPP